MNEATTGNTHVALTLAPLRARQRRLNALRWLSHGLLVGAVAGCVVGVVLRATSAASPEGSLVIGGACFVLCGLIGLVLGYQRHVEDLALARALDRAASSDDRFASAVQLVGHPQQARVGLIIEDAAARVKGIPAALALPARLPRSLRWVPVPLVLLALMLLAVPSGKANAGTAAEPEITPDGWKQIEKEFRKDIEKLARPLTPQEQELRKQLEQLAAMIAEKPEKKEALAEIARLSDKVAAQRKALGAKAASMKSAAKAISASKLLQTFASKLKQGEYNEAANELKKVAEKLQDKQESPDAEEMEAMAADLKRLSEKMEDKEMQQECQNCSNNAGKMNPKELAEALKRLAEQMKKNAECQGQCDNMGDMDDLLNQLKRMMNQGKGGGGKEGDQPGNGGKGGGKGGLKAGWGSAAKWDGGTMKEGNERPTAEIASVQERQGANTTFHTISPDEKAVSGKSYKELYAEFVLKSEADLDLESVPVAYRDYLRRYFKAIRPAEAAPEPEKGSDPKAP